MYTPVDSKTNFPSMEEAILNFWKEKNIFQQSIEQRQGAENFIFFDGPPFATGLPHFGHFVPGTIKDIIPRYQSMRGKRVQRRFGWDCHGLPVEHEMEKELGISGQSQIIEYGIAKFNEACRGIVLRYTAEWEKTVTRMGRWIDFENDYKTMDKNYMESIWWVFKQLWKKNLIYESAYILPYSPKLATPLSNFEVNLGGYKEVSDPAITIRFPILSNGEGKSLSKNLSFLAWTTTPWTIPTNLALALGREIDYVWISIENEEVPSEEYILAKEAVNKYFKLNQYSTIKNLKGADLEGYSYDPPFGYYESLRKDGAFTTIMADFVTTGEGTGIVHLSPGFGEDDYNALKGKGLPVPVPIDAEARFTNEIPDFTGLFVKDADKPIIQALKAKGRLLRRDNYLHNYPHCYRSGGPLIYRAINSWFVDVGSIKSAMIDANKQISWVPDHLQQGRFGKWLENARDWAISRNRFWGNPIPVWKCEECGKVECIGSIAELETKISVKVDDLHKHIVDTFTWDCSCGKGKMQRVPEVLDCWFESGAMPYAQNHYPFENKKEFEDHFPADFIAEGLDQTRGWFYTLTVLAAALFESPAYQHVIVNGLVLASDGRKMSKSARNYSDPVEIINTYGADALRLFLMYSTVVKAEDMRYSDEGVRNILKSVIIPLWSTYTFFVTYANIDKVDPRPLEKPPNNPLDTWVLSSLQSLIAQVRNSLDSYDLQKAVSPLVGFIDQLNNWYIRRSRRRFWKSENDSDKMEAYSTLYEVLIQLVKVAAPFIPFITEEIFRNLRSTNMKESVHLCDFPEVNASKCDLELEEKMALVQRAVSLGRTIRNIHNLKVRQPLTAIHLVTRNQVERNILIEMEDIIRDELNVKEVILRDNEDDLVIYHAKANFKILGPKLGSVVKKVSEKIEELESSEILSILEGNTLHIEVEGIGYDLSNDSILVQRTEKHGLKVHNEGSLTVALDPHLTEELVQEGMVRDLIRSVQNLRKEQNFDVSDRICLTISTGPEMQKAIENFRKYFMQEVLCTDIQWSHQKQLHSIFDDLSLDISKID